MESPAPSGLWKRPWAGPAAVAAVFAGALLIGLDSPFLRHREVVCAYYANLARNAVRHGYGTTRLGLFEVAGPDLAVYDDWRRYAYPNRPPVSVLITSLWFHVFGDREAVMRLSLIAASLGTLGAFFALARRLLEPRWAAAALAVFALNPMFWYFSVVAVHLVYALGFSLAAWACWVRFDESRRYRVLTFSFLALACLCDWPGVFAGISLAADAFLGRRRGRAAALLATPAAAVALHLLHLAWIDPDGGLIRKLLRAGTERAGLPNVFAYLVGEGREAAVYFTLGGLGLAALGLRRLPRRAWPLALLGLEEVVFMRLAHEHDYLSFSLVPFFAVAAARGLASLWASPRARPLALAACALAAAQSAWITGDRLTRRGAYEVNYRAGLAVRDVAGPRERTLLTIADVRQHTPFYADRYTAGLELGTPLRLMVHPSGGGAPVGGPEDLGPFLSQFDWVLVGDPEGAAREIAFFRGQRPPDGFWFLGPDHPLRKRLEAEARSKVVRGPFLLYSMSTPR
jgi:hypothetical protein